MTSECLYDPGEEAWEHKVHVGCGNIYLDGYWNVDMAGLLAREHPDLREQNTTVISDYYARLDGTADHLPKRRPTVVDEFMDMAVPQVPPLSVQKIVAVQTFEHLTPSRALTALTNWHNALAHRGILALTVPDMHETIRWLKQPEHFDFAVRHLLGSGRDEFNWHQAWYTPAGLSELLHYVGFDVEPLPNFHIYPAICVKGHKP